MWRLLDNPNAVFLCVMGLINLTFFACVLTWLFKQSKHPPANFYITDFWAAVLGLAPSYCFVLALINSDGYAVPIYWILAAELICYQILGMWAGRIVSIPREHERLPLRLSQFALIFLGAIVGAIGALATYFSQGFYCIGVLILFTLYLVLENQSNQ